jgi:hypothetical protein
MKKIIMIVLLSAPAILLAQNSYLGVNIGYGIPLASEVIGYDEHRYSNYYTGSYSGTEKVISGSYGSGSVIGVSYGYVGSKSIGFDLEVDYLIGKKYKLEDSNITTAYDYYTGSYFTSQSTTLYTHSARSILITPSFMVRIKQGSVAPHVKIGPVLGIVNKINTEFDSESDQGNNEIQFQLYGGLSIGFRGSAGVSFQLNPSLSLVAELTSTMMSYYPKKGKILLYKENGVDQLSQLSVSDKEVEFVKESSWNGQEAENEPSKILRESFSFGSLAVSVGIMFTL